MKQLTFIILTIFSVYLPAQKAYDKIIYVGEIDGYKYTLNLAYGYTMETNAILESGSGETLNRYIYNDFNSQSIHTLKTSDNGEGIDFYFSENEDLPQEIVINRYSSNSQRISSVTVHRITDSDRSADDKSDDVEDFNIEDSKIDNFYFGILEKSFPKLQWMNADIDVEYASSRFGYESESFNVVKKNCNELPQDDPCYDVENNDEYVLLGRFNTHSMKESYNILYTPGPSHDPMFRITDSKNVLLWEGVGDEMAINNYGIIYTAGNSNRMFNQRMKFQITNKGIREVKQPYYYVGITNVTLKPIELYSHKDGEGEVIARLPEGYEIEVLLCETNTRDYDIPLNYLVRTSFGLVGWLRLGLDDTYLYPIVNELRYHGD